MKINPEFRVDNPGGEWLAKQRERARLAAESGLAAGSVTGYFTGPLDLPAGLFRDVPSTLGRRSQEAPQWAFKLERIRRAVSVKGFAPAPILVFVEYDGSVSIDSGAARLQIAWERGEEWISADIRYFAGGEAFVSPEFSPSTLLELHRAAQSEADPVGADLESFRGYYRELFSNGMPREELEHRARSDAAQERVYDLLRQGRPVFVAWSGGKDSSVILTLVLVAAANLAAQGGAVPQIVVTHANTQVENPEMEAHVRRERVKIQEFAKQHNLKVDIKISTPNLPSSWALRTITGKALPPLPSLTARSCSTDWKVKPQETLVKGLISEFRKQGVEPVSVLGTRFAESSKRKKSMTERGESGEDIWKDTRWGNDKFSPIAEWQDSDVWRFLGRVKNGEIPSYSNMEDLHRIYRDGSSEITREEGCDVFHCRYGCAVCTAGKDKSMEQLIRTNPDRYGYMEGLLNLQKFIVNTANDFTRRQWIGRTVDEFGFVKIVPDTYGPGMVRDLLRYCLTLDADEVARANFEGDEPRFELIPLESLILIDAYWSINGLCPAFEALRIYQDVVVRGNRYEIPDVPYISGNTVSEDGAAYKKAKMPPARYLYVGREWLERNWGLRDPLLEMCGGEGCMGTRQLADGTTVMDVNRDAPQTAAYYYYMRMGAVSLAKKGKQVGDHDLMLRRTTMKWQNGLLDLDFTGNQAKLDQFLYEKTISNKERKQLIENLVLIEKEREEELYSLRSEVRARGGSVADVVAQVAAVFNYPAEVGQVEVEEGRQIEHAWNVLPDGSILDLCADEYGGNTADEDGFLFLPESDARCALFKPGNAPSFSESAPRAGL